ncbi:nitrate reductase molybdenum cofactor assembly chaperone [Pantoea sp. ARC607]|uniref:nitrate reductase molybdenum cofactor assembly chaperone n=1 Tax=unclassified Pantoea TaxID=2630326 RepID=UPI000DA7775D|nr:nitrate reductase molybdenum cofactor assembly chaperone [Pantoea sp. ARC607]PZL91481.1 nitrate reductase molybdenum cofactor assembly chaperone [Pantoea sp. ARC607]
MITLRIVSRLLDYPDEALFTHARDLTEALDSACELSEPQRARLADFIQQLCARPLLDVQADYCELFDRGRATSLLLFEHVHGESRDRGQAMVDLLEQYRADGLELDSKELPDYLPLYLEYLACKSDEDARQGLDDIVPILALLTARLEARQSPYADLFAALLALSGSAVDAAALKPQVAQEARDDTPAALDAVWEEEQIKFLGEQGCVPAQQAMHQRRFAAAVTPQYLDIAAATARTTGESA